MELVPKNFLIRCPKCSWGRATSGVKADLTDLHEVRNSCPTCGRARKFKCPKCGTASVMRRIHGNKPTTPPPNLAIGD